MPESGSPPPGDPRPLTDEEMDDAFLGCARAMLTLGVSVALFLVIFTQPVGKGRIFLLGAVALVLLLDVGRNLSTVLGRLKKWQQLVLAVIYLGVFGYLCVRWISAL